MAAVRPDPASITGETLLGRYSVEGRVAVGGFAVVYKARHLKLDVPVAVKVLTVADRYTEETRASYLALFRQEAHTLAALNHPALVRVLDFGTHGDRPWIAMEWLDGTTLEDDLRDRDGAGRSPREVLELLRPAFDALTCAHDAGVSHRDVKPANLMLVKAPRGAPSLRVIDFGVAKVDDAERDAGSGATATASTVTAFTVPYAAPEQVTRTRTGPWTDVHALALVVVETLTGARAYGDVSGAELVEEVFRDPRPTPARVGVDVGPWEAVLARALARLPSARPASAAALWTELSSSVEEAQAAWVASPRARVVVKDSSSAVTRVESGETLAPLRPSDRPPPDAVPTAVARPAPSPPTTDTSALVATFLPPRRQGVWLAVVAVTAVVCAAGGWLANAREPGPVPVLVTTVVPPEPPPAPAPIAASTTAVAAIVRPAPPAKLTLRRPLRPRPAADASAPAEPTVFIE